MQVSRTRTQSRVDGRQALVTEVLNDSPAGGQETDLVITVMRSNSELQYFVMVAPSKDLPQYSKTFSAMMESVRLR
jgi:hypothetical protein